MSGEELKPAAWLYEIPGTGVWRLYRTRYVSPQAVAEGWTETPLYAHPPAQPQSEKMREALENVRHWVASLTVTDMNEIVADGGITAGMVVGQEANEQLRRIDAALTPKGEAEHG